MAMVFPVEPTGPQLSRSTSGTPLVAPTYCCGLAAVKRTSRRNTVLRYSWNKCSAAHPTILVLARRGKSRALDAAYDWKGATDSTPILPTFWQLRLMFGAHYGLSPQSGTSPFNALANQRVADCMGCWEVADDARKGMVLDGGRSALRPCDVGNGYYRRNRLRQRKNGLGEPPGITQRSARGRVR